MPKKDKYASYEQLSQTEREDIDYCVTARPIVGSKIAVIAPHGGKIEFYTSELAASIAGDDHNFYTFKGLKKEGNRSLHITSHRFDEPRALELIKRCEKVIAVHGLNGDELSLQVGGHDAELRSLINEALCAADFDSKVVTEGKYAGIQQQNICNRGSKNAGVQLEIAKGLRRKLKKDDDAYAKFVKAVRSALLVPIKVEYVQKSSL